MNISVLDEIRGTALSVALAVAPLAAFFLIFQLMFLRLPPREIRRIVIGSLIASVGLFVFLLGVNIGFMPFGRAIGESLGRLPERWLLIPFGLVLGFVTTWGEPAVRILAGEVEEATSGSIRKSLVLNAICVGVAIAVGLGMFRIGHRIPLLWLVVPGYALILVIMWMSDKSFVSISIDAGGVATGPLANTFLLALGLGTSAAMGDQDPLVQGLGLAALIALAPIISIMLLGLVVRWKGRRTESHKDV